MTQDCTHKRTFIFDNKIICDWCSREIKKISIEDLSRDFEFKFDNHQVIIGYNQI